MIRVTYKDRAAKAAFKNAVGQVKYGVAVGITKSVQRGQATGSKQIDKRVDRPTPYTQRGVGIKTASKYRPKGAVFLKDRQAEYMTYAEHGGTREPRKNWLVYPAGIKTNKYGNIPRKSKRLRSRDTFVATGRDKRTAHLEPGIYQRGKAGRRKVGQGYGTKGNNSKGKGEKRSTLTMLAKLDKSKGYKPFLGFEDTVQKHLEAIVGDEIEAAIESAFRSAR